MARADRWINPYFAVHLALLLVILLGACAEPAGNSEGVVEMSEELIICELEVTPVGEEQYALSFVVSNQGDQTLDLTYFKPFADFELEVFRGDQAVPIIQPAFDTGLQPVALAIEGGESGRIETPIRLNFDPEMGPSGGDVPTLWTLLHEPVAVTLRATLQLGSDLSPVCEARLDPSGGP